MISSAIIQNYYVKLYDLLRHCIWPMETVQHLAELEIAIYQAMPNLDDIGRKVSVLYADVRRARLGDEGLQKDIDEVVSQILNACSEDSVYYKLYAVNEVLV